MPENEKIMQKKPMEEEKQEEVIQNILLKHEQLKGQYQSFDSNNNSDQLTSLNCLIEQLINEKTNGFKKIKAFEKKRRISNQEKDQLKEKRQN
jgi:hypothetical protein